MIEKPAGRAATWLGGFAITATALVWVLYLLRTVISGFIDRGFHDSGLPWQTIAYVAVMSLLTFSAFMYLLARRGALYRSRGHVRVPRAEIDAFTTNTRPSLTVLVSSDCEDPGVVRSTLLSASQAGCQALPNQIAELLRCPGRGRGHDADDAGSVGLRLVRGRDHDAVLPVRDAVRTCPGPRSPVLRRGRPRPQLHAGLSWARCGARTKRSPTGTSSPASTSRVHPWRTPPTLPGGRPRSRWSRTVRPRPGAPSMYG
ncbi:MAG: hypothetical protein H7269_04600 [Cellulomonas sp.]|nr:hypothetical protein [Cellulomonas sp.]